MDALRIVERILWTLPELLMLFIAIQCISRRFATDAVLMLVGAILGMLTSVISFVIWEVFYEAGNAFDHLDLVSRVNSYAGVVGHLLFLVGVMLFVASSLPPRRTFQ